MPQVYAATWTNALTEELSFATDGITPLGRSGDWHLPPYTIATESSPGGGFAVATAVVYGRPQHTISCGIQPFAGLTMQQTLTRLRRMARPELDDGTPNRGYLSYTMMDGNVYLMPAVPMPWQPRALAQGHTAAWTADIAFQGLDRAWSLDPVIHEDIRTTSNASWASRTQTITPGGDDATAPTWLVYGPTSGTLNTLSIANAATGYLITLAGLGMVAGDVLRIPTAFMDKQVTLNGTDITWKLGTGSVQALLRPDAQSITVTKNASSVNAVAVEYRRRVSGLY